VPLSRVSPDGRVRASTNRKDNSITVWDDPRSTKGRLLGKHQGLIEVMEPPLAQVR
jgi:hypothetical protein